MKTFWIGRAAALAIVGLTAWASGCDDGAPPEEPETPARRDGDAPLPWASEGDPPETAAAPAEEPTLPWAAPPKTAPAPSGPLTPLRQPTPPAPVPVPAPEPTPPASPAPAPTDAKPKLQPSWRFAVTQSGGVQGALEVGGQEQVPVRQFASLEFTEEVTTVEDGGAREVTREITRAEIHSLDPETGQMQPTQLAPPGSTYRIVYSGDLVYTNRESYDPNTDANLQKTGFKRTPVRPRHAG